jgi:hypothetical protein
MHPIKYRLFLFSKLPMAFLAGLRITELDESKCTIFVKYRWLNTNPFASMYFAVQAMAAEMSTGVLCLANIHGRKPGCSMLVVQMEAQFQKRVTGYVHFTCADGAAAQAAINKAIETGESQTIVMRSEGINDKGEVAAVFQITWSFKAKGK